VAKRCALAHDRGFFEFCCTGSNCSVDPVVRYNIS